MLKCFFPSASFMCFTIFYSEHVISRKNNLVGKKKKESLHMTFLLKMIILLLCLSSSFLSKMFKELFPLAVSATSLHIYYLTHHNLASSPTSEVTPPWKYRQWPLSCQSQWLLFPCQSFARSDIVGAIPSWKIPDCSLGFLSPLYPGT